MGELRRSGRRRLGLGALLCLLLLLPAFARALEVPHLTGRVVDLAGLIPPEIEGRITAKLADQESRTTDQVAVLTIASLEGEPIEKYSLRVARTWGLGQKKRNNGVLLLVSRDDRQMRIEVGSGLELVLTNERCQRILDDILRPAFRKGDFGGGIERGVEAILKALGPPPAR
jgi:uncharacterized protein